MADDAKPQQGEVKSEERLTWLSTSTTHASVGGPPSMASVAVRWNFAFSFAAAFCFFCALIASPTPIVVGMAAMVNKPMTMIALLFRCLGGRRERPACLLSAEKLGPNMQGERGAMRAPSIAVCGLLQMRSCLWYR